MGKKTEINLIKAFRLWTALAKRQNSEIFRSLFFPLASCFPLLWKVCAVVLGRAHFSSPSDLVSLIRNNQLGSVSRVRLGLWRRGGRRDAGLRAASRRRDPASNPKRWPHLSLPYYQFLNIHRGPDSGSSKEFLLRSNAIIFRGQRCEPGTWSELKVSLERSAQGYDTI